MQAMTGVRADFDVAVSMRDGVVLRANVFRPDDGGAGTYPVLLTRLPYGKDLPLGGSVLPPAQVARRGYIVVVQDVRGCFTSEGEWRPMLNEAEDGADTVAWAARLFGASGQVGMYGASYFGFTQWAAARAGAPALRAMVPMITWADPHQGVLTRGGVAELGIQENWTLQQGLDQLVRRHRGDVRALGAAFFHLTREYDALPEAGYAELPVAAAGPLRRLGLEQDVAQLIEERDAGTYTLQDRLLPSYDGIDVPALHIGGWYDVFLHGTLQNFAEMRARGRPGQTLLLGPWTHGIFEPVLGERNFGMASSGYLLDLQTDLVSLQVQFFDRWLKGLPNGFDQLPAVKYFVMGANVWRTSETWPPAGVTPERWYLRSGGHANSAAGDGALARTQPEGAAADTYVYDPAAPVPTVGGATLLHPMFRSGPRDQARVEARHDVLVYTSEPLTEPLEVTGPVRVLLHVATDAPDTDFVARLVDVAPDGTAFNLTDGITRMRYREGMRTPLPALVPGQAYPVAIDLWSTSAVLAAGHRLRLDVTSSSFPRWERNLNTGEANGAASVPRVARQTVLHDAEHASYLELSVQRG